MNYHCRRTSLSSSIPHGLHRHVLPVGAILLVMLTVVVGCAPKPANTLQGAVSAMNEPFGDAPDPGRIVEQDVRGDWAYVQTESYGHVGHGEFVIVNTNRGRVWTVLSFAIFEVRGKTLRFVWMKLGGNLAQAKEKTLDKGLSEAARAKWQSYLTTQGFTIEKPR